MTQVLPDYIQLALTHTWQIAILVGLVHFLSRTVARNKAHLAHLLWLVVILKCLTPPLWSSQLGIFCWMQSAKPSSEQTTTGASPLEVDEAPVRYEASGSPPEQVRPAEVDHVALGQNLEPSLQAPNGSLSSRSRDENSLTPWSIVFQGWLTVTWIFIVTSWVRTYRLLLQARKEACEPVPELDALVRRLRRQLGVRREVQLVITRAPIGPAVLGIIRPVILLPDCLLQERPVTQLEPIVAHELLHIRRGDLCVGTLQVLSQSIWWFNPLVWYASRNISREAERCCDVEVMTSLNCSPTHYARCLLHALELKHAAPPIATVPGVRAVEITTRRLERIMNFRQGRASQTTRYCWATMLALCLISLPGAMFAATEQPSQDESSSISEMKIDVNVTTQPVNFDSDDKPMIVVKTFMAKGPSTAINSVFSDWDVLPAQDIDEQDKSSTFSFDSPRRHSRLKKSDALATSGHSRTVIERNEPTTFSICDSSKKNDVIEKLQQDTRINVLSFPEAPVPYGQTATLQNVRQLPFVVGRQNDVPQVRVVANGLSLAVRPNVETENDVWLDVEALLTYVRSVDTATLDGLEIEVPEVANTRLRLGVRVPQDQTLIVGGLHRVTDDAKTESVIVLMSCRVIHPPAKAVDAGTSESANVFVATEELQTWELSMQECIEISLLNSPLIRSLVKFDSKAKEAGQQKRSIVLLRNRPGLSIKQTACAIGAALLDLHRAYFDLYYYHHNLNIAREARDLALRTWQQKKERHLSTERSKEASRKQYFFFRGVAKEAKRDLRVAERQLRYLMGISPNDGRVLLPTDDFEPLPRNDRKFEEMLRNAISSSGEIEQAKRQLNQLHETELTEGESLELRRGRLARLQRKLDDIELEISHVLSDAVRAHKNTYDLARTAFIHRAAAQHQLEVLSSKREDGIVNLDLVLDAQRESFDAKRQFVRTAFQNTLADVQVRHRTGELLKSHSIVVR